MPRTLNRSCSHAVSGAIADIMGLEGLLDHLIRKLKRDEQYIADGSPIALTIRTEYGFTSNTLLATATWEPHIQSP